MKNNQFGEKIYKLRKERGFSQKQLGALLGVSGKAVSKWETYRGLPSVDTTRKLAEIFGVTLEMLFQNETKGKEISKIVITGGPCAGKTTAISYVQNHFSEMGYAVLIVPETATELIMGGVTPWGLETNLDYQLCQMKLQMEKEQIFIEAAQKVFNKDKILIVCDRGTMDNKAYINDSEFSMLLSLINTNRTELRDRYDAVFHLVTAAKGAEEFYTTANNAARTETVDEARDLDDKLISAWTGHPHLRVIDNSCDFKDKINRLLAEISAFLGEPEPYETERKFLIEYPDIKKLEASLDCRRVEIIQTYLRSNENEEVRVRQRGEDGHFIYFKTTKRTINGIKRVEIEQRLTKDEYLSLLMDSDTSKRQIRKNRYCLMYENQYFEIDVYPFWDDKAIMEIELRDENQPVNFPKFIKVIKEVTDDPLYKNSALARIEN